PGNGQLSNQPVAQLSITFTEPIRDAGPAADHSATNPAAYALVNAGPDGAFGTADDLPAAIASVAYDAAAMRTTLGLGGALADGLYRLTVRGADPNDALFDLAGTPLDGGDAVVTFTIDTTPPQVTTFNPAPGQVTRQAVTQIAIGFSEAV